MPILVINENGEIRIENLDRPLTRIGRDKRNDIQIESPEISRFHCQIQRAETGYYITDLNSRNGTFVNGSPVRTSPLEDGDMIHLGDVHIIFRMEHGESQAKEELEQSHAYKVIQEEKLKELEILALEREHLLKLQNISIRIASVLDMGRLLRIVLDEVVDLTRADRGLVMLIDSKNRLTLRAQKNMNYAKASPAEKQMIKELIQQVLVKQEILSMRAPIPPQNLHQPATRSTITTPSQSILVLPLKTMVWEDKRHSSHERRRSAPLASQLLGIIYLAARHEFAEFTSQDLNLIEAISHHVAVGIANAKLHEMATTDRLTGLYNRGYFEMVFDEELRRAKQTKTPLTLIITDIDHFKKFNDTHGHQIGDQVLRDVAQTIRRNLRDYDVCARYGGEELVFILPKTTAEQGKVVAEKIRSAVEQSRHTEKNLQVTISLGVAAFPEHAETKDMLIKRADQALYKAKRDGRNCWRIWQPDYEQESGVEGRVDKLAGILSGDQAKNYQNLQLLLETISILNSGKSLDDLLEALLDKILEVTHADRALIFLADRYDLLAFRKGRAKGGKTLEQASMYSRSIPQKVFETGQSACLIDDGTDSEARGLSASMSMGRFQLQTVMCVPLQAQGQRFGVLYVDSHIANQEFTDSDLIFLEALANQISVALHHAQEVEQRLEEERQKRQKLEEEIQELKRQLSS